MGIRSPSNEGSFCQAIREKRIVRFKYRGEFYCRIFHPYIMAPSPKDETVMLVSGIQVRDESDRSKPPAYRTFDVGQITYLNIREAHFQVDEKFRPRGGHPFALCVVQ